MYQVGHDTSIIAITGYEVIQKLITKVDFQYKRDVNKRVKKVYLVERIQFSY